MLKEDSFFEFYDFREGCPRLRRFFDGNGKSKDAFQYRGWIYAYVFTALYFHYVGGTNRRSFANFIECELELLKRVFLPVINLSPFSRFDLRRIRWRTCAGLPFVPRSRKNICRWMKDGRVLYSYIFEIWKILVWYCIILLFVITKRISTINFHDFRFFNSLICLI